MNGRLHSGAGGKVVIVDLGRIGIWCGGPWRVDDRAAEAGEVAAELERLGYGALWLSGGFQPGFTPRFRMLLEATERVVVASGIISIWLANPRETAHAV